MQRQSSFRDRPCHCCAAAAVSASAKQFCPIESAAILSGMDEVLDDYPRPRGQLEDQKIVAFPSIDLGLELC